jgi:hypothetical protein
MYYLWVDDMRPIRPDWVDVAAVEIAKNYDEAIAAMLRTEFDVVSLDHDLGACDACMNGRTPDQWLQESNYQSMPHCSHAKTGYDILWWMTLTKEANPGWGPKEILIHTANPVGRKNMQGVLARYWENL